VSMRVIAVANQKGGVGKTTTVVNVAAALADQGRRVILMDFDPQAHLTTYVGTDPTAVERSSHDVLTGGASLGESLLGIREGISLLPASLDLAAAEQELVAVVGRETVLRDALAAFTEPYDYVFIDCPPSLGLLTLNALSAAREVFIPLQPHFLSLQGLSQLLESVMLVNQRINRDLKVTGLLFCMYDSRTSLSGEIVRDVEAFFAGQREAEVPWRDIRIFETRIRGNIKLAESPSYASTIFEYAPGCNGALDYASLAGEIEAMCGRGEAVAGQAEAAEKAGGASAALGRPSEPAMNEAEPEHGDAAVEATAACEPSAVEACEPCPAEAGATASDVAGGQAMEPVSEAAAGDSAGLGASEGLAEPPVGGSFAEAPSVMEGRDPVLRRGDEGGRRAMGTEPNGQGI